MKKKICNMCGKEMDLFDAQENFSLRREIGYGSRYDGEILELNLCCDCMDRIIEQCKIRPVFDYN